MANDTSTVKSRGGIIAKLAAGYLNDHMQFCKSIDKADVSDFAGKNGYSAGDTVQINLPTQFTLSTGADITSNIQDMEEASVALTVNNQYNVAVNFTSAEIATDIAMKEWAGRVLKPAMITLANNIEKACLSQAVDATSNTVGTAGSTTFDTDTILSAGEKIDISGCADYDNRFVLLNPAANRSAVNERKGLFQSSEEISKQYKAGAMGIADGFTFLRNNLLPVHTNGNDVTGLTVNGAATEGASTLAVSGLTATTGTVTKGTVFTIAGIFKVHPVTKDTLSELQQFVVTADATADGSGNATLSISPALYTATSGSRQNIASLPAGSEAITAVGAASTGYAQNLAYHKSAFRFVSLPLVMPNGVHMAGQESADGITVRVIEDYDVKTDKMILRCDVLWGLANVRPEFAARITS